MEVVELLLTFSEQSRLLEKAQENVAESEQQRQQTGSAAGRRSVAGPANQTARIISTAGTPVESRRSQFGAEVPSLEIINEEKGVKEKVRRIGDGEGLETKLTPAIPSSTRKMSFSGRLSRFKVPNGTKL